MKTTQSRPSWHNRFVVAGVVTGVVGLLLATMTAQSVAADSSTSPEVVPFTGTFAITATWGTPSGGYHAAGDPAIDVAMPTGTPIYAAGSGTVSDAVSDSRHCDPRNYPNYVKGCIDAGFGGSGTRIRIQHPDGTASLYLHLSAIQSGLVVGATVVAGQRIGTSGNTGISEGPHLHYAEFAGSADIDPGTWVACHGSSRVEYTGLQNRKGQSIRNDGYACSTSGGGISDTDGDQVPDSSDLCRTTQGLASTRGCPLGRSVTKGEFNGDGVSDFVIWDGANWAVKSGVSPYGYLAQGVQLGGAGVVPMLGEFNGDGVSDFVIWDGANWAVKSGVSPYGYLAQGVQLGGTTALPLSAPARRLRPLSVPGAPANVTAVAGDGQVAISWQQPADDGGANITGYRVTTSSGQVVMLPSSVRSTMVSGLANGTPYTFAVAAQNARGVGPSSASTPPVVPTASGTLTGVVRSSGGPLSSAVVRVYQEGRATPIAAIGSDSLGNWSAALPSGTYNIQVVPPEGSLRRAWVGGTTLANATDFVVNPGATQPAGTVTLPQR